jgi:tRNA threonylcarbamoyladenosine biosynthesis protein TsaB
MDARRGQVYNALFKITDGKPQRLCPDRAISVTRLAEELLSEYTDSPVFLIGDGAELCAGSVQNAALTPEPIRLQTAWGVAMEAMSAEAGGCHALKPVYLRPSQAERERAAAADGILPKIEK